MKRRGVCVLVVVMLAVSSLVSTAWAAALTITSKPVGAHARAKPSFYPQRLQIDNCPLTLLLCTSNAPENGDRVYVRFNSAIRQSTLCDSWTDDTTSREVTVTATIHDNAGATGNDTLTVTAVSPASTCTGGTIKFGSIDLGASGYVTATIAYGSSTFKLSVTTTSWAINLTLDGGSTGQTVPNGSGQASYSCDTGLLGSTGAPCGVSKARTESTVQF